MYNNYVKLLFRLASFMRRIYWFTFRPRTIGVKCLIERNGKYLFIKHSYGSRMHNWNLPGGGLKRNESTIEAAKREVFEELGLRLSNLNHLITYVTKAEYKVDTVHCFYSKLDKQELLIDRREVKEAVWFDKQNLPENCARSIRESLAALPCLAPDCREAS